MELQSFKKIIRNITTIILEYNNQNKHLIETKPGKYVYHVSNPKFRELILKQGLIPRGKSESWLEDTEIIGKVIFATNTPDKKEWFDSTFDDDVYEIDTTSLSNKWFFDPNFNWQKINYHIITFENIPANTIKLIKQGSGKSLIEANNLITTRKLFHGTADNKLEYQNDDYIFFSEDAEFSRGYGDKLFIAEVKLGKIFDSLNLKHIQILYNAGFRLTDSYLEDGDDVEGYDFEKEEYIAPKYFINSPESSNSWNSIEGTEGVIPWIFKNGFDSILIYEESVPNFLTKRANIISMQPYIL